VSHLSSGTRSAFSVEVEPYARHGEHALERRFAVCPQLAKQIENRAWPSDARVTEGKIAGSANELLELACRAGDFRLVKGIVRPRRELVDEKRSIAEKK
jgi:hypothetical protein